MKVFTLEQARELLQKIKPLVEDISLRKEELMDIIKRNFLRIEEMGGVVKNVDPVQIDFLSYYGGRYIWLCWREDEETIMFWHELNDGITGRKPVTELEGRKGSL